jgi:hypothetical protein
MNWLEQMDREVEAEAANMRRWRSVEFAFWMILLGFIAGMPVGVWLEKVWG